jgi:hypothetical protein
MATVKRTPQISVGSCLSAAAQPLLPAERERRCHEKGDWTNDERRDRDASREGRTRGSGYDKRADHDRHEATEDPERHSKAKRHRIGIADLLPVHCREQSADHPDDACQQRRG